MVNRLAGFAFALPEGQDELGSPPGSEPPRLTPVIETTEATHDRHNPHKSTVSAVSPSRPVRNKPCGWLQT